MLTFCIEVKWIIKGMSESNTLKMNHKKTKTQKFFSGFFFTLVLVYLISFLLICGYYGFSGIGLILLFSIYLHVALFPFLIYSLGGFIFIALSNELFDKYHTRLWKWLIIGCLVCFGVVCLSELAHYWGILSAQFNLTWK